MIWKEHFPREEGDGSQVGGPDKQLVLARDIERHVPAVYGSKGLTHRHTENLQVDQRRRTVEICLGKLEWR